MIDVATEALKHRVLVFFRASVLPCLRGNGIFSVLLCLCGNSIFSLLPYLRGNKS